MSLRLGRIVGKNQLCWSYNGKHILMIKVKTGFDFGGTPPRKHRKKVEIEN
jgi:hypothetical protein